MGKQAKIRFLEQTNLKLSKNMATSDEAVVRSRLLLDGDGTGDDRRLNNIAKTFIKWVTTKDDTEDADKAKEENHKQLSRLMASIAQCEWIENKSKMVQKMNGTEAENYEKLYEKIKNDISQAETQIKQTKEEVVQARKIRRNRMEYDALAKVINKNPDRATQGKKIKEIKADLESLRATEASLEDKLESRKKQFHVLVQSIHNLQALLDEDDDDHHIIESKMELNEDSNGPR